MLRWREMFGANYSSNTPIEDIEDLRPRVRAILTAMNLGTLGKIAKQTSKQELLAVRGISAQTVETLGDALGRANLKFAEYPPLPEKEQYERDLWTSLYRRIDEWVHSHYPELHKKDKEGRRERGLHLVVAAATDEAVDELKMSDDDRIFALNRQRSLHESSIESGWYGRGYLDDPTQGSEVLPVDDVLGTYSKEWIERNGGESRDALKAKIRTGEIHWQNRACIGLGKRHYDQMCAWVGIVPFKVCPAFNEIKDIPLRTRSLLIERQLLTRSEFKHAIETGAIDSSTSLVKQRLGKLGEKHFKQLCEFSGASVRAKVVQIRPKRQTGPLPEVVAAIALLRKHGYDVGGPN